MENERLIVCGKNAVSEALRAGRPVDALYVLSGARGFGALVGSAKEAGAVVREVNAAKMNALLKQAGGYRHGGIICVISRARYHSVDDILAAAEAERRYKTLKGLR